MRKHIVHVGVGADCSPSMATEYVQRVERAFREKDFFPYDNVVFIAHRGDQTYVEEVEVGF